MAKFIASISRYWKDDVTRLGHAKHGITVSVATHDLGIKVEARVNKKTGKEEFTIYKEDIKTGDSTMIASVNTEEAEVKDLLNVYVA